MRLPGLAMSASRQKLFLGIAAVLILVAALGIWYTTTSNKAAHHWRYLTSPLPRHQPPIDAATFPPPPWKTLIKERPSLLAIAQSSGLANLLDEYTNNGGSPLPLEKYYSTPLCTPHDLEVIANVTVEPYGPGEFVPIGATVKNRSSHSCDVPGSGAFAGNGAVLGECGPSTIVTDAQGRVVSVSDSAVYEGPPPGNPAKFLDRPRNCSQLAAVGAAVLIKPGGTWRPPLVNASWEVGVIDTNSGVGGCAAVAGCEPVPGPPPGRYSVIVIIPIGQYVAPPDVNCPYDNCGYQQVEPPLPPIGTIKPLYSKPAYFTIKD